MTERNQFIFVLGPHRSGTSVTAGALNYLGVNLGKRFVEENEDNPKGFFEDEEIVRLNDRLLRSMNLSWDSFGFVWDENFDLPRQKPYFDVAVKMISERFSGVRVAGLKDPRFCILLPFWKRVIAHALGAEVSFVLSIREPAACAISQKARHYRDSDFHLLGRRSVQSILLWCAYTIKALTYVDPDRLVVVGYSSLLESPVSEIMRLAKLLNIEVLEEAVEYIGRDFVDLDLSRSSLEQNNTRQNADFTRDFAEFLYRGLLPFSSLDTVSRADIDGLLGRLDIKALEPKCLQELQFAYGYSYKKIISLRHRLILSIDETNRERSRYESLDRKHEQLTADYKLVLNSRGWKLISALRRYCDWFTK